MGFEFGDTRMTHKFPFERFLNTKPNENKHLLDEIFTEKTISNVKVEAKQRNKTSEEKLDPLAPITKALFEDLNTKIPQINFNTFIKNKIKLISIGNNLAIFSAQTEFIISTVEEAYITQIQDCLKNLMGEHYEIKFTLDEDINLSPGALNSLLEDNHSNNSKSLGKPSFTLDLTPTHEDQESKIESKFLNHISKENNNTGYSIDPSKTFENFIVGPSNNLAFATACAVADSPGKTGKYPSLYIYSDSGLGKTHLLHAVANGVFSKNPSLSVCLISARDFMKELINAYKDKALGEFQRKYTEQVDVLMIDDIHELKNKNSTQEEFFHIFNFLHDKGKQLIFTSDKSPDKITGIEERIITRLQWGLVIDIQKPDFETRTAILKKKALELDLFVQDEVLSLIASSVKTSIRELEGSLIKLQATADFIETEIDTEMARSLLKLDDSSDRPAATLESVCKTSSQYFKISAADLRSKSRSKEMVKARHISWYLSKNIVGATFKEIAIYYGNRDHSSVIHGVNKISEKLKNDPQLSKDILFLENNI